MSNVIYVKDWNILRNLKGAINYRLQHRGKYLEALAKEKELYQEYLTKAVA